VTRDFAATAREFLASQPWCSAVHNVTPVFVVADVLGVFRCTLIPSRPDADVMVWVIVGDLPAAYIVHEPGDSWQDALIGYVTEMRRWVDAVKAGNPPAADIIPVNAPPTLETAEMLTSRLDFIQSRLLDVDPSTVKNDV
jgi:hypothetical protein